MSELSKAFSSANMFPSKLLKNERLLNSCLHDRKVLPVHVQLNPTNLCPFDCSFCSCSGRDRNLQLTKSEVTDIMTKAKHLGCESVTCTGGGEPLMSCDINDIFWMLNMLDIQVGLVTNGLLLDRVETDASKNLVWCRISCSDNLPYQLERIGKSVDEWFSIITNACKSLSHVDWAFSYVLTQPKRGDKASFTFPRQIVEFANKHKFTHTRLVCDILHPHSLAPHMYAVQNHLRKIVQIDDSKVIYQTRTIWEQGVNPCYISLLKPVVGADGVVYPCCGTQYALKEPTHDYEPSMRMGKAANLDKLVEEQAFFNGSQCVKCYYGSYNEALGTLLNPLKHERFV